MCQATHFRVAFRCGDSGRSENIGLPHQGIAELEIFVQVVQAIEKISHVTAENGQHSVVSVLAYEVHEINAHLIHEFHIGDAENLEGEKLEIYSRFNPLARALLFGCWFSAMSQEFIVKIYCSLSC